MSLEKPVIIVYNDAVVVKSKNKRVSVFKSKIANGTKEANVLRFVSLTSEVGKEPGAVSKLSENKKIKRTFLALSDHAIVDLYMALKFYIKENKITN